MMTTVGKSRKVALAFSIISFLILLLSYYLGESFTNQYLYTFSGYHINYYLWGLTSFSPFNSGSSYWWDTGLNNVINYMVFSFALFLLATVSAGTSTLLLALDFKSSAKVNSVIGGLAVLGIIYFFYEGMNEMIKNNYILSYSFSFGFYLLIISMILNFLSATFTD